MILLVPIAPSLNISAALSRCSNLEDPGDTPRKGPLLGQKDISKIQTSATALGSTPSTPSGSAVQLAGGSRGDPEAPIPGVASSDRGTPQGVSRYASIHPRCVPVAVVCPSMAQSFWQDNLAAVATSLSLRVSESLHIMLCAEHDHGSRNISSGSDVK